MIHFAFGISSLFVNEMEIAYLNQKIWHSKCASRIRVSLPKPNINYKQLDEISVCFIIIASKRIAYKVYIEKLINFNKCLRVYTAFCIFFLSFLLVLLFFFFFFFLCVCWSIQISTKNENVKHTKQKVIMAASKFVKILLSDYKLSLCILLWYIASFVKIHFFFVFVVFDSIIGRRSHKIVDKY